MDLRARTIEVLEELDAMQSVPRSIHFISEIAQNSGKLLKYLTREIMATIMVF